ncbi:MAG TPA: glycosyltransferase [Nitrospiraceae bacterium]|nr:glycosyltransferase [Nitrospiraceae bacterium]
MKVLHVLNHSLPYIDGYSIRSFNILQHQKLQGLNVTAVTSPKHERPTSPVEVIHGVSFYRTLPEEPKYGVFALPFLKESLLMLRLYSRIKEIAQREKVDLIHAHSPSLNVIPAYAVGRRLQLPVVYEVRTLWEELPEDRIPSLFDRMRYHISQWIDCRLLRLVDAVTVICEGIKREVLSYGVPEGSVVVVPNGIDVDQFLPRKAHEGLKNQLGLNGKFVIGFIGSFRYWEGLDDLVQALAEVVKHLPNVRLLLVGEDHGNRLADLARSHKVDSHIIFTGKVPYPEIPDYYSVIDLFVYPRKKMRLTEKVTPLKPLEAMALQKLVLASDVGGHRELVSDGYDGVLFKAGDVSDLAKKIIYIAENENNLDHIRKNARASVQLNRSWSKTVIQYDKLYVDLAKRRSVDPEKRSR